MRHSKRKSSCENTFTAPFNLRLCQQRLLNKAKRASKSLFYPILQVEVFRLNDETLDFYVKRGIAIVQGRLDKLDDKSTLVNLSTSINWIRQLPKIVFTMALLVGFGAVHLLNLWFINTLPFDTSSSGATLQTGSLVCSDQCYLPAAALEPFYDAARTHVFIASALALVLVLALIAYRARRERNRLAQEVETALTDQITDIPDLSIINVDGEIVYGLGSVYRDRTPSSCDDVDLLNLPTDKDHDRKA